MNPQLYDLIKYLLTLALAGGGTFKIIAYIISRDKVRAEADKDRAEAEATRTKTFQTLLDNLTKQVETVQKENVELTKDISALKLLHVQEISSLKEQHANEIKQLNKEWDIDRKEYTKNMMLLSARVDAIEPKSKS